MKDYKMYILVNDDIHMGKGKLAGQVGHAVATFFYKGIIEDLRIFEAESLPILLGKLDEYMVEQKKIILKCPQSKLEELEKQGYVAIRDKGYTQLEPNTLTCVNLGLFNKDEVPEWVTHLKLV